MQSADKLKMPKKTENKKRNQEQQIAPKLGLLDHDDEHWKSKQTICNVTNCQLLHAERKRIRPNGLTVTLYPPLDL